MLHFVGASAKTPDGLHDDCPFCRAMRHAGIVPDESGLSVATPAQQRVYEAKLADILAAEGMPEGAVSLDGEEMAIRHSVAVRAMTAEGWPDEPFALPPERQEAFFKRYSALVRGDVDVASLD